jgi:decaprenyl-phosphate phosphoribosyltransferase
MDYLELLRPRDWAKNLFLLIPLFFSGAFFNAPLYPYLLAGIVCFSLVASSIYIINDYRDREDDRKHPEKKTRPIASGAISPKTALIICALLVITGFGLAWLLLPHKFTFVLGIYFVLNLAYSFGLKTIPILDIIIVAAGFVLRVKAGAVIAQIGITEWLNVMVFLLALFMAIGKRRDDVLLKLSSGTDMRKSIKGYNLDFLNVVLALVCAVIVVAYFMYTMSPEVNRRLGTYRLYYTCLFVLAGIMRYLQIIFVQSEAGSPTRVLYRDRFIQVTILLWIASFYLIIYSKDFIFFK